MIVKKQQHDLNKQNNTDLLSISCPP